MSKIVYIDETEIINKRVLLRVDFNVSLTTENTIADDVRIQQSLTTIQYLIKNHNKLILVSHLGNPKGKDTKYSLRVVARRLQEYIPDMKVIFIDDFRTQKSIISAQKENEIIMCENIRFYPEEKKNDPAFAKELSELADIYVNDAFGVSHRTNASLVSITSYLPSYGGLLMKKEVETIGKAIQKKEQPFIAIIGGAKISTKISLIGKLMDMADILIIGGGLANTFLCSQGYEIGKSFCEQDQVETAKQIITHIGQKDAALLLPSDVIVGSANPEDEKQVVKKITDLLPDDVIYDIGPETQARFGIAIAKAKTIIWNGPVGLIEQPSYRRGTDFIYYSVTQNSDTVSIVGGGDTLAAISKKEYPEKITHVSTGGGAMLEFIEKGTLPAIEALKR